MTAAPLTDEQFERCVRCVESYIPGNDEKAAYEAVKIWERFQADARWHRAELAKARAENERLRWLLAIYVHAHDSGNAVPSYIVAEARAALAPEGKAIPASPAQPENAKDAQMLERGCPAEE